MAAPSTTWGPSRTHPWNPRSRTAATWSHSESGGLSVVATCSGSKVANQKPDQLRFMERTAAL